MSQNVEDIKPCFPLFREQEYKDNLANKKDLYEEAPDAEKIREVFEWTTTAEYKKLNFNRQALTVNPAKACQPLGAVLCAWGSRKPCPMSMVRRAAWPISAPISTATSRSRSPASPTR